VAYFTGEVTQDFTFVGRPRVRLEASSSATDTEFWTVLHELPPGGPEWRHVTLGGVRARYREGWESPTLLVPGRRTTIELELDRRVHTFRAGTLMSLGISSSYCGINENPNSGETIGKENVRKAATQTLFLDGENGSSITFDILQE
jgi:predicted acyl esterase